MWALAISTMPLAAASGSRPSGAATRCGDGAAGRVGVERHLAAEEERRVEPAQRQVRVGDGRGGAAQAVARRARPGPRAARADAQRAARVDPRLAAPARAHLHQVDHRRAHRIAAAPPLAERRHRLRAHLHLGGEPEPPVLDQPDLGGGAPHVEREHVRDSGTARPPRPRR